MKSQISFIFLFLLASCSNSSKRAESPALIEAQMIDGLLEVHLLEAAFERKITEEMRSRDFNIEDYYQVLFDNQFYSREEFNQSFSYYSRDPKTMERLLDSVLIRIQILELLE